MKQLLDTKSNIRLLEDFVRSMSKGYYSDFNGSSENSRAVSPRGRSRKKVGNNQLNMSGRKKGNSKK
jgi:hypothetical protein